MPVVSKTAVLIYTQDSLFNIQVHRRTILQINMTANQVTLNWHRANQSYSSCQLSRLYLYPTGKRTADLPHTERALYH